MPELPDVEVFRRYVDATALHKTIHDVDIQAERILEGSSSRSFTRALKGKAFESSRRHGKYLCLELTNGRWLVLHFGMTGSLKYFLHSEDEPDYTYALFTFSNDYHLAFLNPRKLGTLAIYDSVAALIEDKDLGPDPLEVGFTFEDFKHVLQGRRGMLKSTLMNQSILAGIGNVYSDEILFQLGWYPRGKVDRLDEEGLHAFYRTMRHVLREAAEREADPARFPDSWLIPHRRPGASCPRCRGEVQKIKVVGRSGYFCPACQKKLGST
ncbi:MAG: DNA-formamidopyrimidine glycosylase family protein [Anaerolineales bacterium]